MGNLLRARKGPRGPEEAGEVSLEDACSLLGGTGHPRWIEAQRDGQMDQNSIREGEKEGKTRSLCRRTSQRGPKKKQLEKRQRREGTEASRWQRNEPSCSQSTEVERQELHPERAPRII